MAREAEAGTGAGGEEPAGRERGDADGARTRVVALDFGGRRLALTYGDPPVPARRGYDAADDGACYWTVARKRADARGGGDGRRVGQRRERAPRRRAET